MDRDIARLISEGQAAARRGDRAMARELLTQVVDKDPHNEDAWLWLSGVVADPNEQQICLENALVINPNNAQARKGLQFVVVKTGTPPRVPMPSMTAEQAASPVPTFPDYLAPEPDTPELSTPAEAQPSTLPAWMEQLPTVQPEIQPGQVAASDVAANSEVPESWAVPGPVPSDPFVAAAPYSAPQDQVDFAANGNFNGSPAGDMAVTVPYTAPEPESTDMAFDGGDVHNVPLSENDPAVAMNSNGNGNGNGNGMYTSPDVELLDERPFVPPPGDEAYLSTGETDAPSSFEPMLLNSSMLDSAETENTNTNLPSWLDGLSLSEPVTTGPPEASAFPPFDMSGFGSSPDVSQMTAEHDPNMPFGVPEPPQVGPYSAMRLPSPHELPTDDGMSRSGQSQPWYLQSGGAAASMALPMPTGGISSYLDNNMLNGSMAGAGVAVMEGERTGRPGAMIACPNCKEEVPETSLACPNCRYNFFVNCPRCHELVDTSDALPGHISPCPYCKADIDKMEMGLGGVTDLVSQKNPGSRPAAAVAVSGAFPTMKQAMSRKSGERKPLSFNWVVDLLWLVTIILMVWALTQLPTWLNLSGLY